MDEIQAKYNTAATELVGVAMQIATLRAKEAALVAEIVELNKLANAIKAAAAPKATNEAAVPSVS